MLIPYRHGMQLYPSTSLVCTHSRRQHKTRYVRQIQTKFRIRDLDVDPTRRDRGITPGFGERAAPARLAVLPADMSCNSGADHILRSVLWVFDVIHELGRIGKFVRSEGPGANYHKLMG